MTFAGERDRLVIVVMLSLAASMALAFAYHDQIEFVHGRMSRDQIFGRDFAAFWVAAKLAIAGRFGEIYDIELFHRALTEFTARPIQLNPFPYPPHGALLLLPVGLLPYAWSFALWMVGLWTVYAVAAARGGADAVVAAVLLLAPSTVLNVTMGQNGFLTAALMVGGMSLLFRAPAAAGILFGLLTFKPQLGLLIPFALIAGGHWRAFASAALTAVVLVVGSVLAFGIDVWAVYLRETAPYQRLVMEQATGALTQMVPSAFMAARLLDMGLAAGYALQALMFAAAAAGVVWAFRRGADAPLLAATLFIGTFLASPYVFNYDMTVLSVAVIYLVQRGLRHGFMSGERLLLGLAWLLPIGIMYAHAVLPVAPPLLAAVFAMALLQVRRGSPRRDASP